jgi:hypothetical protein
MTSGSNIRHLIHDVDVEVQARTNFRLDVCMFIENDHVILVYMVPSRLIHQHTLFSTCLGIRKMIW